MKKIVVLKCHHLSSCASTITISQLDCDVWRKVDFIWHLVTTSLVVRLRRSSKTLSKASLASEKVMVTVWWSAADLTTTAFWIPAKTLCLRSMLSKSMRCTKNCNACTWSTEKAQFFSTTIPDHVMQPMLSSCLICHIHLTSCQPTPTSSSALTTFCEGKLVHNQQEAENAFQELIKSRSRGIYATGINKLISRWWKCVDWNCSCFD